VPATLIRVRQQARNEDEHGSGPGHARNRCSMVKTADTEKKSRTPREMLQQSACCHRALRIARRGYDRLTKIVGGSDEALRDGGDNIGDELFCYVVSSNFGDIKGNNPNGPSKDLGGHCMQCVTVDNRVENNKDLENGIAIFSIYIDLEVALSSWCHSFSLRSFLIHSSAVKEIIPELRRGGSSQLRTFRWLVFPSSFGDSEAISSSTNCL